MDVFGIVGTVLKLGDVFHTVVDNRWAELTTHNLVGIVTYYGKHYSTFFFHTKLRVWIYFDDATVREIGPRWEQVVEKCRRGRYQPLLLLYATPVGTPVSTDNAPKQVTSFYPEISVKKKNEVQHTLMRRSVTPSPEKPNVGNTRRAITPNPDFTLTHKPPLPRPYNEYQNLSVIQDNLYGRCSSVIDVVDGDIGKEPDYIMKKTLESNNQLKQIGVHRTPSNGSSSGVESFNMPDHHGSVSRRRDSGNWSGDRNSASSSSSTTMENPYLYLVGKLPQGGGGSVPGSPTRVKPDPVVPGNGHFDAGYDSYSLSSNDSSTVSTIQHLMKMGHLAQIPEDYANVPPKPATNCDVLCEEADELLTKSRHFEDEHDLVLALALCNAAATKARAAMNAPYNNPQTLTLARMKHNTCIMRARSLHRRMTQSLNNNKDNPPEIRHTREGSSGSGRHSRQNSRDKGQHSRQNSKESPAQTSEKQQPQTKTIEIYATLPKKRDGLKQKVNNINIGEDEEYVLYDKPPARESRSIFSRSKKDNTKVKEKRSRSEDRNKLSRDFSIAPEILLNGKDTLKRNEKTKEEKEEKKDKDGKPVKKQHKIRRKLLMGGLIKRKNRSMPDLTEGNDGELPKEQPVSSVDDSNIGVKGEKINSMCGYLSEGHLEFSGNITNPNLERSKLMRKSFHGSAGKVLTVAKVPPPPPLRTTSQLSTKLNETESDDKNPEQYQQVPDTNLNYYHPQEDYNYDTSNRQCFDLYNQNLTNIQNANYGQSNGYEDDNDVFVYQTRDAAMSQHSMVVTRAEVHQVQSPAKQDYFIQPPEDGGIDEVDFVPSQSSHLELPPYPSPVNSVIHSRQPSEEFPPPPPPLDLTSLHENLPQPNPTMYSPFHAQNKRLYDDDQKHFYDQQKSSGDTWLKELQAKQAALKMKKSSKSAECDQEENANNVPNDSKTTSVKDLASHFEKVQTNVVENISPLPNPHQQYQNCRASPVHQHLGVAHHHTNQLSIAKTLQDNYAVQTGLLSVKKRDEVDAPEQCDDKSVDVVDAASKDMSSEAEDRRNKAKKKSVSFCDQVILVATAEEQEDDSYIPNPILERVLRTAMNKPETMAIRQEIMSLRQNELTKESPAVPDVTNSNLPQQNTQMYSRQNSIDNLLSQHNPSTKTNGAVEGKYHEDVRVAQVASNCQYSNQNRPAPYQIVPTSQIQGNQHRIYQPINAASQQYYSHAQEYPHQLSYPLVKNGYPCPPHLQNPQIRQSPLPQPYCHPVNQAISNNSTYQHSPSPSPSVQSYSNQPLYGQQTYYNRVQQPQQSSASLDPRQYSPYQRVPPQTYDYYNAQTNGGCNYNGQTTNGGNYSSQPVGVSTYNAQNSVGTNYNNQIVGGGNYNPSYEDGIMAANLTYQRIPSTEQLNQYQRNPNQNAEYANQQNYQQQRLPDVTGGYHSRLPQDSAHQIAYQQQQQQQQQVSQKYSPYQQILPSKQVLKKTVSFEPGTKGGTESPTPKAIVTPIIVNNNNNNINVSSTKVKCNLCRKKHVSGPNLYCMDCEFYMSRFKPKS